MHGKLVKLNVLNRTSISIIKAGIFFIKHKGGKVEKIEWSIMVIPPKIVAVCATCRYELARVLYNGYKEREEKLKTLQLELSSCPKCKATFKI